jgi:hypothetical protein
MRERVAECGKRDICTLPASSSFRSNGLSNGLPEHSLDSHTYWARASEPTQSPKFRRLSPRGVYALGAPGQAAAAPRQVDSGTSTVVANRGPRLRDAMSASSPMCTLRVERVEEHAQRPLVF